jgi:hypothetical protein
VCHARLAETRLPAERIAALPEPPDHARSSFLSSDHGRAAARTVESCQICHARQQCDACHVDAAQVTAIRRMSETPPGLMLPPIPARYDRPASHDERGFLERHGPTAGAASCGACHTREECTTCHVPPAPQSIAELAARAAVAAPGVVVARTAPASHTVPGFMTGHGGDAATRAATCRGCHATTDCAECHDDTPRAVFHAPNFIARHSAEAFGRRLECSNCHETQTFCRDCHVQTGMQTVGRLNPGFHDAEPLWLLRHGTPARRALESCTTCHRQRDCLQCHSTLGSFRVSPHRPGFDARTAQSRNAIICRACHVGEPIRNE